MTDMSFFPSVYGGIDYKRFDAAQFVSSTDYAIWTMPRGARFVYLMICGAGQSGAGGLAAASGPAAGGGGGAGGGFGRALCPAFLLPKRLWVQVARGGASAPAGAAGNQQTLSSQIGVLNSQTGALTYLSIASTGTAPAAPTTVKQVTAGSHSFNTANSLIPWVSAAPAGALGDILGPGANANTASCGSISGGAAGAGCAPTYAAAQGGSANLISLLDGRVISSTGGTGAPAGGTAGSDGQTIWYNDGLWFQSTPGAGGGNASTGQAGNGGKGGLGCGGGGGGAANGGGTAGASGPGGDGVIILACW